MKCLLLLLILCPFLTAQVMPGARQAALCNSDIAVSDDVFAIFSNPAGLAQTGWREIGVFYSPSPFGLTELANGFAAYNEPTGIGTLSFGAMTYGYKLYRENKFLLSYSKQIVDGIFIGTAFNYHLISIKNYGSEGAGYFNIGTLAYFSPDIRFGFSIVNINHATFGNEDDQIPMLFNSGLNFNYSNVLLLSISLSRDIRYKTSFSGGIEYLIRDILFIRSGLSTEPFRYSGGTGIHHNHFTFDYAFSLHQELGITHQVSLIFSFNSYKNRTSTIKDYLNAE
jgi:hypothetical protein